MRMHRRSIRSLSMVAMLMLSACGSQVVNPVTGRTEYSVMDEAYGGGAEPKPGQAVKVIQ